MQNSVSNLSCLQNIKLLNVDVFLVFREVLQNAYATGHRFHVSNVEKIHLILESHVEVLNKVCKTAEGETSI